MTNGGRHEKSKTFQGSEMILRLLLFLFQDSETLLSLIIFIIRELISFWNVIIQIGGEKILYWFQNNYGENSYCETYWNETAHTRVIYGTLYEDDGNYKISFWQKWFDFLWQKSFKINERQHLKVFRG